MIDWVQIKKDGRNVVGFGYEFVIAMLFVVGAAFNIDSVLFGGGGGLPSGFALYIPLWFFRAVVVVVGLWFSHRLIERYTK